MKVERVVLDTNVLISAIISSVGKPFTCLRWVLDNATLIASRELLEELETSLARPKFAKYLDGPERRTVLAKLTLVAVHVELRGLVRVCRDPQDDKVLETAAIGRADYVITGDQDLLILGNFEGIPIVTPADFLGAILPYA